MTRLRDALAAVRRACPDLAVLATLWMHIRHPLPEPQLALLQPHAPRGVLARLRWVGTWLAAAAGCLLYSILLTGRVARYRARFRRERSALNRESFDVVAKTWCFPSTTPEGEDFYFGDLQPRLAARRVRMLLLCGGAEGLEWPTLVNRTLYASGIFRIPLWCLVPWTAPLRMAAQQVRTSLRLNRIAGEMAEPLAKRVAREARLGSLSRATARAGLYYWVGQAVARQWHPKSVITLYEGSSWENCLWWGVKSVDPTCRTVGYQHTVFFQESLALMNPTVDLPARSLPDVALCLGTESAGLMRPAHERHGSIVVPFGGFRCRPGSRASTPALAARRTVLVTPEGLPGEVSALFGFALACAKQLPGYRFVLRCHPSFPMQRARAMVPGLVSQPNIIASDHPALDDDVGRASVLLYRGSSSVLYAIAQGLLPVYVHVPGMRDVDPLFRLSGWRAQCATSEAFAELLQQHEQASPEQLQAEWQPAAEYVATYTQPVEERSIDELVHAAGLNGNGRT